MSMNRSGEFVLAEQGYIVDSPEAQSNLEQAMPYLHWQHDAQYGVRDRFDGVSPVYPGRSVHLQPAASEEGYIAGKSWFLGVGNDPKTGERPFIVRLREARSDIGNTYSMGVMSAEGDGGYVAATPLEAEHAAYAVAIVAQRQVQARMEAALAAIPRQRTATPAAEQTEQARSRRWYSGLLRRSAQTIEN